MNQLSKKAIASILSLVLVFVALGATTFAWFTLGTTATVGQFDLEARGSEGLEVQIVGSANQSWYSSISSTIMNGHVNTLMHGTKLEAVTTDNVENEFKKFSGVLNTGKVDQVPAEKNVDYLEFELKFRTAETGKKLHLKDLEFTSQSIDFIPGVLYTDEFDTTHTNDGITAVTVHPHFASRISFDEKTYQHNTTVPGNLPTVSFLKGAHDYLGKKYSLTDNTTLQTDHEAQVTRANADTSFVTGTAGTDYLIKNIETPENINGKDYFVTTVTIRVWYEGWDSNTYDAIFEGKISIKFGFELKD